MASSSLKTNEEIDPPLMDKISQTLSSLNAVKKQINDTRLTMEQKHKDLFLKCVRAQQAKESAFTAVIYAFKCAQARKTTHLLLASQLELEQVVLQAETAEDFCQTVAKLTPIIRKVTESLARATPEVTKHLEEIGVTLDTLMSEIRDASSQTWVPYSANRVRDKPSFESGIPDEQLRDDLPFSTEGVSLDRAETQTDNRAPPSVSVGKGLSHLRLLYPQPVTKFFFSTSEKLRKIFHAF